jgi:hypothetical protein
MTIKIPGLSVSNEIVTSKGMYVEVGAWIGTPGYKEDSEAFLVKLGYKRHFDKTAEFIKFDGCTYPVLLRTAANLSVCASAELDSPKFSPIVIEGLQDEVLREIETIDPDYVRNMKVMEPFRKRMKPGFRTFR